MNLGLLDPKTEAPIDMVCPVNWLHPLNRGLVGWWLCLPGLMGGSTWVDLCRKNNGTLTSMDPATDWKPSSRQGSWGCLDFTGTNEKVTHDRLFTAVGAFTVCCWLKLPASPANLTSFWGKWDDTTATKQQFARWNTTAGGRLEWFVRNSADSAEASVLLASSSITKDAWVFCACTANGSTLTVRIINPDGVVVSATASLTGPYIPSDTTAWKIGWGRSESGDHLHDDHCYYGRDLSLDEILWRWQLSIQGYPGLLRRVRRYVWPEETAAVGRIFKIAGYGGDLVGVSRGLVA